MLLDSFDDDYDDYDSSEEDDDNWDILNEDEESDGDWDYQEEDKSCTMCAGTGFMGAADGEDDETGCDEVTCPFCMGSGIK